MSAKLCALGAIVLWATLASLGVLLEHVPPFLLTGVALVIGSIPSWPLVRQWRVPATTLALGIYGLLLLSIMIATFGIVITLLLAVYERRRETGLLRAVGMTRAQVRTTVRWESVITSLYGAFVGVLMGLVLGYVIIVALRDKGLTKYTIPVTSIVWIMLLAFTAGVIAAVVPAWRATRLGILRAIAADG